MTRTHAHFCSHTPAALGEEHSHDVTNLPELPDQTTIELVSAAMKQLGDPTRLHIFWLLCHYEECVINIAGYMKMSSPAVSHHLRLLKESGLLTSRRVGKEMYYRAADTALVDSLHHAIESVGEVSCPPSVRDT
ncbi:hypothetical protein TAMA11512_02580 [Selenomonas sp. TAMA-11512]|uniref:ArsR/SmtB family transcription factor n=1 Tax=Selenomonas sp. TAMA-11512 TaxID=3095337 RepID=UPI003090B286|nr:hypothetical protein TAMA11512_02580 [Selenomonas sp. TAMA-11512]